MRSILPLAVAVLVAGATADAQTKKPAPPKTITLTGCVERDDTTPDQFTVIDRNGSSGEAQPTE